MNPYDLVVLGAGPGGYSAALEGARLGASVALIERDEVGGTCLHRGCIPAKTMYEASRRREPFGEAVTRRYRVISELHGQLKKLLSNPRITIIPGDGVVESPTRVRVTGAGEQAVEGRKLILATGSLPVLPETFRRYGRVLDSDGATFLEDLPKRAFIIGGGYTGCEYAGILNTYGADVTIVERGRQILHTEDEDIVGELAKGFEARRISILMETSIEDLEVADGDLVLVAIGRTPDTAGIGLEELGVRFGHRNGVNVNERMETGVEGVYAIGDMLDEQWRFAHVAEAEARVAARNALGRPATMGYDVVPSTIFTDPLIVSVGARERELERGAYVAGKALYAHNSFAHCSGDVRGFFKLLVERESPHRILGAAAVGQDMDIHAIAVAMTCEATVHDIAEMIHFHPSRAESIKAAAEMALRRIQVDERRRSG